jgi:threonine synthase
VKLVSTKNKQAVVSFKEALFKGLPDDNGLYVPAEIPRLDSKWLDQLTSFTLQDIAIEITKAFIGDEIPAKDIETLVTKAIDFPAPLVSLHSQCGILELFHGPSLAFKDFGARFMSATMSWYLAQESRETTILVATSGDTGGAVAYGFLDVPGIKVVILYPSGKVSALQEKQLTSLGHNITALEIEGSFDDCQAMVKQAFLDPILKAKLNLSSANSINIARLIPQTFYYAEAYKQAKPLGKPIVCAVPSGNFGNLTAGLYAQKMGFAIQHFIAATNANAVFPRYINEGIFEAQPSIPTLSNAMDVGNPSNFYRILDLYGSTWNTIKDHVSSYSISNEETLETMRLVMDAYGYALDPHTAVAYQAITRWQEKHHDHYAIVLETAHPSKFLDVMSMADINHVYIPERLAILQDRSSSSIKMGKNYQELQAFLLQ